MYQNPPCEYPVLVLVLHKSEYQENRADTISCAARESQEETIRTLSRRGVAPCILQCEWPFHIEQSALGTPLGDRVVSDQS